MSYLVWNIMVWQLISPEVIVKGCVKYCILIAMDDTDDYMLWNGDVRSVRKMKPIVKYMKLMHLVSEKWIYQPMQLPLPLKTDMFTYQ